MCVTLAGKNFTEQYQSLDPDVYYVKLDDDTMYVGEQAIDMMLHEKLRDRFLIVSANVINHSGIYWLMQYLCLAAHHMSCCSTSVLINSLHCKYVRFVWRFPSVGGCITNNLLLALPTTLASLCL